MPMAKRLICLWIIDGLLKGKTMKKNIEKKKVKRNSINKAKHKLEVLKARGARPRRIARAQSYLAGRLFAEEKRKEREAEKNKEVAQEDNQ